MESQFSPLLQQRIIDSQDAALPALTRRNVWLPAVAGKALAVIDMRRTEKPAFVTGLIYLLLNLS
ncbi:MAG: hypothetical protein HKUEN07_36580 [Rhodocyclaceae bacterium]|nr:MAG: hypothetical protein HKUEN07_36580 [Rhodocyclaceae bacterium]